ncbi:dienelactone hydrolase family protein [Chitinibacter bivalviorum]|uniref:Dienelactone hydrolase family protein n=1 Tax=Chitinibacter bivalviorum TaxID=2739434 RepID=A0A7H9BEE8_9NEIS|nr:dienelactone hydrolase family protein [Chitinibacter bivalviorum]QLG87100.1 dienelactone hydrolase family protein [Chitinibacter bivalviorum]
MNQPSRRDFLKTTLLTGFALAVQPVAASTIQTDSTGLTTESIRIGEMPAYLAKPANASGALPTVIVIQEIFGVHEHIQDICRRLAKQGYLAIAPELYYRQGDPRQISDINTLIKELVMKVPDAQVMSDLDATAQWAAAHGGDQQRLAVTGFCWGGRITWLYAAHNPNVKASAAWYGRLTGDTNANFPRNPIDIASQLKSPVLGLYGGKDQGISQESVAQMLAALKRQRQPFNLMVYEDAAHGFNADYRPSYHAAAAQDGWKTMLAWFKQYGV